MHRSLRLVVLLAPFLAAVPLAAQPSCAPGQATALLDVNDVEARLFNQGNLFFGESEDGFFDAAYRVPVASGSAPLYMGSVWVGGTVDGELRAAAATYSNFEFWPGPLSASGEPPADCVPYDRIYVVSRADIQAYEATGTATPDLADWPHDLGAPVVDGDGDPGNYSLSGGDRPHVLGDQMAWWVMNDAAGAHASSGTPPLGLEVQVSAFAAASGTAAIDQATFYRYRLVYRGSAPLDSAYVGFYLDADLGDAADDYVGSDTTLGLGYAYNADDFDDVYGIPPAVGLTVVHGPAGLPNGRDDDGDGEVDEAGERLGMTALACPWKNQGDPFSEPTTGPEYYACLRGLHTNGEAVTEGGVGYALQDFPSEGPETTFYYPGDPVDGTCWSMVEDCNGDAGNPSDVRFLVAVGPFRMAPGDVQDVVVAIPFAQGADHLDSVTRLRSAAATVRSFAAPLAGESPPQAPAALALRAYPNPFTDRVTVAYTLAEPGAAEFTVVDVLGRVVAREALGTQGPGPHVWTLRGASLPPGLYLVRVEAGGQVQTRRVVKAR